MVDNPYVLKSFGRILISGNDVTLLNDKGDLVIFIDGKEQIRFVAGAPLLECFIFTEMAFDSDAL